ncbi:hypothetical protein NP233_g5799 [Leucocoprinus birnbaumii]|uniref:NACHT domain-containing protein n=1 Tax=Leucocoprinus birnbaumii TaxID=56174 RepID=A0AAD5VSH9_9AGAR|nr:hypothetical protein NP233_g5799 [Leucocoprinus birnbaumii]
MKLPSEGVNDLHSADTDKQEESHHDANLNHYHPQEYHQATGLTSSSTFVHDQYNTLRVNYTNSWKLCTTLSNYTRLYSSTMEHQPPASSDALWLSFLTDGWTIPQVVSAANQRDIVLPSLENLLHPDHTGSQSYPEQSPRATELLYDIRDVHTQHYGCNARDPYQTQHHENDIGKNGSEPTTQLFVSNQPSTHPTQSSSRNGIAGRRQDRRPSPLAPRLDPKDVMRYAADLERSGRNIAKGRNDDLRPGLYLNATPQLTISQSRLRPEYRAPQQEMPTQLEQKCTEMLVQPLSAQVGFVPSPKPLHFHSSACVLSTTEADSTHKAALRNLNAISGSTVVTQGPFANAQDFVVNNPAFIIHQASGSGHSEGAMNWLRASMLDNAQHDSAGRDPPPRCHPDTRISILDRTHQWIDNPKRDKRLIWIRGPAGVGKSAIVQTLADSLALSGRLGASLFFSRPNGRSNPRHVFPTIAYQLASQNSTYRAYIETIRPPDSHPLEARAMKEQFRLLVIDPLVKHRLFAGGGDILIAIDGLDECNADPDYDESGGTRHRGRSLQQVHREIIELVSGFVRTHPSIPVIWVIASRPESHITAVFQSGDVKESYVEESILVDDKEACEDVEKFLVASFKKIAEAYPDHITMTPWPAYAQFLQIAQAASGLFIFAEVVIRFIDDPEVQNPISQLDHVLAAIAKLRQSKEPKNPLSALDVIYTAILVRIPPARMEDLKKLLPLVFYVNRKSIKVCDYKFRNMYEHLEISRGDAITSFNHLHSVIYFPRVKDLCETQPRFYHASFRDYLEDSSRSGEYAVTKWNADLTWPLTAAILGSSEWSNLSKSMSQLCLLFKELSPSGSVARIPLHRYRIPDSLLQEILDGLSFRSLLLENFHDGSFQDLLQKATKSISQTDELQRRRILRQTTLASLDGHPSDEMWISWQGYQKGRNTLFDYRRSGHSIYLSEEYATQVRAGSRL